MVNVVRAVPVDNEISLLRGYDRAASESGVDVESGSFGTSWGIYDDGSNVVKSPPIAPKIFDIDLIINRGECGIISRERKILYDSPFGRTSGFGHSAERRCPERTNKVFKPRTGKRTGVVAA